MPGISQSQAFDDLTPSGRVCGGGQRNAGHRGKALMQNGKGGIFTPEVVSPLRYAMRFVDGKQRQLGTLQQLQETRREQTFWSNIQQIEPILQQLLFDLRGRLAIQSGI